MSHVFWDPFNVNYLNEFLSIFQINIETKICKVMHIYNPQSEKTNNCMPFQYAYMQLIHEYIEHIFYSILREV